MNSRNERNQMARYESPLATRGGGDGYAMAPNAGPGSGFGPQEVPESGLLQMVWRRRWMVYVTVTVGLAAAFAYLSVATPIYTAASQILVSPSVDIMSGTGNFGKDLTFQPAQMTLMTTAPILNGAISDAQLNKTKTFNGWTPDATRSYLRKNLALGLGKSDNVITIAFDSPYPDEAALVVNSVVESYIREQTLNRRTSSDAVQTILEAQKEKYEDDLNKMIDAKTAFQKQHGLMSMNDGDRNNVIMQALSKLSDALTTAQLETVTRKAQYDASVKLSAVPKDVIQLAKADSAGGASFDLLAAIDKQLSDWETQRDRMAGVSGPNSPAYRTAEANVSVLTKRKADLSRQFAEAYVSATKAAYEGAAAKEAEIQKAVNGKQQQAFEQNSVLADFAKLSNDQARVEKLIEVLDNRIKDLGIQGQNNSVVVRIYEAASPPAAPSKPQLTRIVAMGLLCGLAVGIGGAWLRDFTDPRLKSPEEVRAALGLPLLGVVPRMAGKVKDNVRGQMCHLESMSDVAEAYRTLRTAIYFGSTGGQVKTMLVTSPAPGDGKSTTASNLAIAMAQAQRRTLLIDTDFRKPTQHKIFNLKDEVGLSSVLSSAEPIEKAIQPTGVHGLDLLPCGPIPGNPSELLNSEAFEKLLEKLSKEYDHVVLDSPPVLSVADARILGAVCDKTVMVLRQQKSTKKSSQAACDEMLNVGSRLLGVVVNDVPRRKGEGYYGQTYAYGRRPAAGAITQSNGHRRQPDPAEAEVVEQ